MKIVSKILFSAVTILFPLCCAYAGAGHDHGHGDHEHKGHSHDDSAQNEPERGPRGGRLLKAGDFAVEVTIFEKGVPPQFRVFLYDEGTPLPPTTAMVAIELIRFGGKRELFELRPGGDYLTVEKTVEEPHSFDVRVTASRQGQQFSWEFQSHEGRTELSEEALRIANLTIEQAGPQVIGTAVDVFGRLLPSQNRVAHLIPRFAGVVREVRKDLGDRVQRGDVLAVIESNQSLQPYEIRSQIAGEVIARHATVGEYVRDDREIFVVADLSEIWADFQVYRDDFNLISKGQNIQIAIGQEQPLEAAVIYVAPVIDEVTQSKLVRAVVPNSNGMLRPGLFVMGSLSSDMREVPLAVRREAIQTFRDWNVVYLTDGHTFQAIPVELGRRDANYVEVLSGLSIGDRYVARNSFIVKADIEKSGATHDH
jgi:cobalt-zinc-cadmium efflux system membrane fusion protein